MTPNGFAALMGMLGRTYRKPLDVAEQDTWRDLLGDEDDEIVLEAARDWIQRGERSQFFPNCAELFQCIRAVKRSEAELRRIEIERERERANSEIWTDLTWDDVPGGPHELAKSTRLEICRVSGGDYPEPFFALCGKGAILVHIPVSTPVREMAAVLRKAVEDLLKDFPSLRIEANGPEAVASPGNVIPIRRRQVS